MVGRRGLVGLFVNKFTMTPRVEGSNPCFSRSFIHSHPERRGDRHEKKRKSTKGGPQQREIASAGAANQRSKTGRRFRKGYEKGVRFISKMIKWLTPSK